MPNEEENITDSTIKATKNAFAEQRRKLDAMEEEAISNVIQNGVKTGIPPTLLPNTNNWSEEFDDKFAKEWNYRHVVNADVIKSFIHQAVSQARHEAIAEDRKKLIEKIRVMKVNKLYGWNGKEWHAREMLNGTIDKILSTLTKLQGDE